MFEITTAQNRRANNINRTSHQKVTKLKSKFSLTLGWLNQALNNPALTRATPNAACTLFSLPENNFNGWVPKKHIEWIVGRKVLATFNQDLASMVEGYEKYFKQK